MTHAQSIIRGGEDGQAQHLWELVEGGVLERAREKLHHMRQHPRYHNISKEFGAYALDRSPRQLASLKRAILGG